MKGHQIMKYGFDTKKGIFTLKEPETGKDWSNHFFNDLSYIMSVTHTGATFSRYVDKNSVQVTLDCPLSSYLYLRDAESKKYWNIAGYPSLNKISGYKCEHGQQFTRISSSAQKIFATITYAIAPTDTREVWKVTVKNTDKKPRVIDLIPITAFDLNGFAQPVYYSSVTTSFTEFVGEANAIFNENRDPYRPHELASGYIASSEPVYSYDGNYEKFIGTMGTQTKPYVLEHGLDCTRSTATVRTRGGILQNRVTLAPGEEKVVYYILGLTSDKQTLIKSYPKFVAECEGIISDALNGEKRFGNLGTSCPEPQFNHILNYWAEHQVSYCMLGKKAVRDNAQLGMAMLNFNLPLAKKTIDECVAHQYKDGHAVLTWYPYLEPNIYSDPSAWMIYAVCGYVKESGDFDYLNRKLDYLDGGSSTVYEHLKQAIAWFERKDNYGAHGLPRIHHADWNDALNIPDDKAESVLMAMLICKAYDDMIELATYIKDCDYAEKLKKGKAKLVKITNAVAFNGDYYVRAFSKYGVVGDKTCENGGKIYVNTQSWSILSGVCPKDRLNKVIAAMDSTETDEGIPMCVPSYKTYDETVGRMSGMLPGVYENGGIYNHAGCFKVMADCKLGRGDNAVNALKKIAPDGKFNPSSKTTTEPYVFTNCYLKHPSVDMQVGFSWQTGTSAWGLMCYYEGILGLQRGYDGLHINPALPSAWKTCEAKRTYRGNRLNIKYYNKGGKTVRLTVDGKKIEGNVVPLFDDNDAHDIKVELAD